MDLSKMSAESIYDAGTSQKNFDFNKGFNALLKADKLGLQIYYAGSNWKKFNFDKGLDALIKIEDRRKKERGEEKGYLIYNASFVWDKFNYSKALKALKNTKYYKYALEEWPKGVEASMAASKRIKSKAKILPMKKLKLEHLIEGVLYNLKTPLGIYIAGRQWKKFDFEKGLDALIKKDIVGNHIYNAGSDWKKFNYKKGFDALIKTNRTGEWIYWAGMHWKKFDYKKALKNLKVKNSHYYKLAIRNWPKNIKQSIKASKDIKSKAKPMKDISKKLRLKEDTKMKLNKTSAINIYFDGKNKKNFDYEKGLDDLIKADKTGHWIWNAGYRWKEFNYEKGLDALIKKDNTGEWIFNAGREWEEFDYSKGLKALKNIKMKTKKSYYYFSALKKWPKNIEASKSTSKDIKSKAKPMKDISKKLRLKEDTKMKFKNLFALIKAAILYKRKNKSIKEDIIRLAEQKELQKSSSKELTANDKRSLLKATYKKILTGTPYANNIKAFQQLINQVPDDYIEYESQINLPNALKMVDELIQGKGDFTGGELKNIMNIVAGIGVPAIEKHATGKEKLSKEAGTFGAKAIDKNTAEMLASMEKRKSVKAIPSRTMGKEPVITSKQLIRPDDLIKLFKTGGLTLTGEFGKTASQIRSRGMNMDRIAKSLNNIIAKSKNYKEAEKKAKEALKLDFQENLFRAFFNAAKKEKVPIERK